MQQGTPTEGVHKTLPRRMRVLFLVLAGLISLTIWFGYLALSDSGPIPGQYRRGLDFTLYYPTRLPAGYSVDQKSFQQKDGALIYTIRRGGKPGIAVSQQALPADQPTHQQSKAPVAIAGEQTFKTAIGDVQIGFWGDKYVADIITDETWIILNVNGFTIKEATAVAQSFTKIE